MSQQFEIEFKNLLTKAEYEQLLEQFEVQPEQIIRQVNHYFDTPQNSLKNLSSGLRIRVLPTHIECTLKEKTSSNIHLETTDLLLAKDAERMLNGELFNAPEVCKRLALLEVNTDELQLIGTLTTDRTEIIYDDGTLVFDHSFYLQTDDYEVEYETNDEKFGKNRFSSFLKEHNIPVRTAPKKIARFMNALKGKDD